MYIFKTNYRLKNHGNERSLYILQYHDYKIILKINNNIDIKFVCTRHRHVLKIKNKNKNTTSVLTVPKNQIEK